DTRLLLLAHPLDRDLHVLVVAAGHDLIARHDVRRLGRARLEVARADAKRQVTVRERADRAMLAVADRDEADVLLLHGLRDALDVVHLAHAHDVFLHELVALHENVSFAGTGSATGGPLPVWRARTRREDVSVRDAPSAIEAPAHVFGEPGGDSRAGEEPPRLVRSAELHEGPHAPLLGDERVLVIHVADREGDGGDDIFVPTEGQ